MKGDAPGRISLWYTFSPYANFFRLMSQPTQDSTATAPDTIIMTLQKGGMIFCTLLPTPQAALPSSFVAALPTAAAADTAASAAVAALSCLGWMLTRKKAA